MGGAGAAAAGNVASEDDEDGDYYDDYDQEYDDEYGDYGEEDGVDVTAANNDVTEGNSVILLNNGILVERINQNKLIFLHLKGVKLETSTDWHIGGTTFEGGETSLKHRHLLFFKALV